MKTLSQRLLHKGAALGVALLGFVSCGLNQPNNLYAWYGYDDIAYEYSKSRSPEATSRLIEVYKRIITKPGGSRRRVPPGIYAEYGYLLIKQGKQAEGVALLRQEIELYPESKVFVTRIIEQLQKTPNTADE